MNRQEVKQKRCNWGPKSIVYGLLNLIKPKGDIDKLALPFSAKTRCVTEIFCFVPWKVFMCAWIDHCRTSKHSLYVDITTSCKSLCGDCGNDWHQNGTTVYWMLKTHPRSSHADDAQMYFRKDEIWTKEVSPSGPTLWNSMPPTAHNRSLTLAQFYPSWRPCYSTELTKHCHSPSVTV